MPHQSLTHDIVAQHNTADDLWCIIDHKAYDLSDFLDAHPGGSVVLTQVAGQDATTAFYNLHRQEVLQKYAALCVGTLDGETPDGPRFALALLGALAFAGRAGCRPVQVRRFAEAFVRTTLDGERDPSTVDTSATRALRAVDTLYLLHGARAFAGDARMLVDVALMLEGDESVN